MKKEWLVKILAFGIILLLFCMSITSSFAFNNIKKSTMPVSNGNTLYVGGNGTGNYTKIQDAIDNATYGDTVFVFDDSSPYYENLVVNKSISLVGEDKNTTIINGTMTTDVVEIISDWVNLTGFLIINGTNGMQILSNYNTINNNVIINNRFYGVDIDYTCNNVIIGNNISSNGGGIRLWKSNNTTITENEIFYNIGNYICLGIYLYGSIYNNITNNNIDSSPCNIHLFYSNENTISQNIISNGRDRGVQLHFSNNNIISRNIISYTKYIGLQIEARGNKVIQNNFIQNKKHVSFTLIMYIREGINRNSWTNNYFDNWIGLEHPFFSRFPKIIKGILTRSIIKIPVFAFDWHPAKEPYDILIVE